MLQNIISGVAGALLLSLVGYIFGTGTQYQNIKHNSQTSVENRALIESIRREMKADRREMRDGLDDIKNFLLNQANNNHGGYKRRSGG